MNYEEVIENLTIERVESILQKLEIPFVDKGTYLQCKTACHNIDIEEASEKLYFYKDNKIFVCYTECGTMSIFKFIKKVYKTRGQEYDWYNDVYRLVVDEATEIEGIKVERYRSKRDKYKRKEKSVVLPEYSSSVLDVFCKLRPQEWLEDGISAETMEKFNIMYWISRNKIIIPHYDINNRLIGIRGRALNQDEVENFGKYMPIQVEKLWYKHPLSMNLYGLNINKENIKKNGICYLFESEKAVLQMESFPMDNCGVAVCGSNFNKFQLSILMKTCQPKEIVICFDNEEEEGQEKYFFKLWNICKKYSNYCNFSFVYDRKNLTNKKDSPTDKGYKVFLELISKRVYFNEGV